jgi:cell wall assembly regulator SMI1
MQDLIRRADGWLKANRPDYYAILRPGVDDAAIYAYEARFGLVLPAALKQLYRWRRLSASRRGTATAPSG